MPQPLSQVKKNTLIIHANQPGLMDPFAARPKLAAHSMQAVGAWSLVEYFMLSAYVRHVGGAHQSAAKIFLGLGTRNKKEKALNEVMEARLDERQLTRFKRIMRQMNSTGKKRDKLAHWVPGYSDDLKNCLLFSDPRQLVNSEVGAEVDRTRIFCFFQHDFEEIVKECSQISFWGYHTINPVWPASKAVARQPFPPENWG